MLIRLRRWRYIIREIGGRKGKLLQRVEAMINGLEGGESRGEGKEEERE